MGSPDAVPGKTESAMVPASSRMPGKERSKLDPVRCPRISPSSDEIHFLERQP
jgi:hypothetical protein